MPNKTRTSVFFGVSLSKEKLDVIDSARGYYTRSGFILMALDTLCEQIAKRKSVQSAEVGRHLQTDGRASTQTPMGPMIDHE
jgi:hypothetical protein